MAIVVKDRVKETTTNTGQGTVTLLGAVEGYVSFETIGDGNTTYYTIYNPEDGSFEVGIGTYTSLGTTLSRTTVLANSLGTTAKIDFTAGVKDVFCTYPAEKAIYEEVNGDTIINGGPITIWGSGISATPNAFGSTVGQMFADVNNFSQLYNQNLNGDQYASSDFVAYNDQTTDGEQFYVDMGINSSGFDDTTTYPIFPQNSAYVYSAGVDGGTVGQNADLYIGTGTSNSDVVLFVGGLDKPNIAGVLKSATQALVLQDGATALTTDSGEKLQVYGTAKITGATTFESPVTTSSTSVLSPANNEFVTKAYVDNAASAGLHIHTPVAAETSAALSAVYTQGGTTFNITDITGTNTVVTSTTHGLAVDDEIWLTTTAGNGLSINTPYFVYATPTTTSLQLTATWNGPLLTGLTNASGLSYATRANSGVGAYLEASANEELPIADVIVGDRVLVYNQSTGYWNGVYTVTALGANDPGGSKWKLTRATDADFYSPASTDGLSEGDYFFVQSNSEAYVLTTTGPIIIGYTTITYTLFSSVPSYVVNAPLNLTGNTLSLTGIVDAVNGGTGYGSYTVGQMLYADTTTTLAKLGVGSQYQSLLSTGSAPSWGPVPLSQSAAVSGSLGATNGGTGQATYTTGDMLYSDDTNSLAKLSGNTSTTKQFLTQTGTGSASQAPAWGTISGSDVTSAVSSATNLAGGAANRIAYQTGSGATGFATAPSASGTFLGWNGSAFAWSAAGSSITDDTTTNTNYYPVWANATSGAMTTAYVSSTKYTFNPSTGLLTIPLLSMTGTTFTAGGAAATYGAMSIKGSKNGWSGISFYDSAGTFCNTLMARSSDGYGGILNKADNNWLIQWDGSGNVTATANITAYSDETLKTNWRDLPADFVEQLAQVKHGTYDRVDEELTQDGVSAQSLKPVLPNSVLTMENGKLAVAYGNAAMVSAVQLAKRVVEQDERIARLEELVAKLSKGTNQ